MVVAIEERTIAMAAGTSYQCDQIGRFIDFGQLLKAFCNN